MQLVETKKDELVLHKTMFAHLIIPALFGKHGSSAGVYREEQRAQRWI